MKRISYVFLAMATAVVMAGSLSSCQDYEEDLRAELKGTQSILDKLKESVEGAGGLQDVLDQAKEDIEDINAEIAAMKEEQAAKDDLQNQKIEALEAQNAALQTALQNASDALAEQIAQSNAAIAELRDDQNALAAELAALAVEMSTAYATMQSVIDLTERVVALETWKTNIDSWKEGVETWKTNVDSWKESVEAWKTNIDSWKESVEAWKADMDTWKTGIDQMVNDVLPAQIKTALDSATAVSVMAKANLAMLEQHKQLLDSLAANDTQLAEANAATNARIDSLIAAHNALADSVNNNIAALNALVTGIEGRLTTVEDLAEALEARVAANETLLSTHTTEIADLKARVETLEDQVLELMGLKEKIEKINNYLNQLITGILVQGANNPIYGSFSLPFNMQSNLLAAYYGEITTGLEFPSTLPADYAKPTGTVLSDADLAMLGISPMQISPSSVVISDAADNAGKLYLTINPTNVDFTGATFSLVNSLDETSKVTLSPVAPSYKKLSFGWTRAVENGFYEMDARIEPADVANMKMRVDINAMKTALKDIAHPSSGINVSQIASAVYSNTTDILDALALKAAWRDSIDDEEMAVYSHYAVGATAVKPLSYKFAQDLHVSRIPGFDKIEDIINKSFDKITFSGIDVEAYKFNHMNYVHLNMTRDTILVQVEVTFNIPAGKFSEEKTVEYLDINSDPQTFIVPASAALDTTFVTTAKVPLIEIYADVQGELDDMIDELNSQLSKINDMVDEVGGSINNIFDGVDDVQASLIGYLDKLNDRICKVINNANSALQPVILIKSDKGYSRMSGVRLSPSHVSGTTVTLVPTSYTAEILAPAYQKLVGVTNVWNAAYTADAQGGDADCLSELNRVNGHEKLAEVYPGNKESINDVTLKSGYVYEITYTSVDYFGKVAARKGYVKVD